MKILVVTTSFLVGGVERSSSTMANYFSELEGVDVVVLTQYKFRHFYKLNENIKCIEPNFNKIGVPKLLYYLKIVLHFRKHIKKENPDVILSYGEYCNFQVLIAKAGLNIPTVISDRASPELKIAFPTNLFRKLTYRYADGFIAQTERMKQSILDKFNVNYAIKVIPNAIRNVELFSKVERKNQILAIGRIHPIKQFDKLIDAFELAETADWELLIVGDGVDFEKISNRVKNSPKSSYIKLESKSEEVDLLMAESKIFALTSYSEGFPNSLCEAMAAGLVCVSFDIVAGPKELIEDGKNGFLIEPFKVEDFAQKLTEIIASSNHFMEVGLSAQKSVENLGLDHIGKEYFKFLVETADNFKGKR